jgi:hypothetical protein
MLSPQQKCRLLNANLKTYRYTGIADLSGTAMLPRFYPDQAAAAIAFAPARRDVIRDMHPVSALLRLASRD